MFVVCGMLHELHSILYLQNIETEVTSCVASFSQLTKIYLEHIWFKS